MLLACFWVHHVIAHRLGQGSGKAITVSLDRAMDGDNTRRPKPIINFNLAKGQNLLLILL